MTLNLHKSVVKSTSAGWFKRNLDNAGINKNNFIAHST